MSLGVLLILPAKSNCTGAAQTLTKGVLSAILREMGGYGLISPLEGRS